MSTEDTMQAAPAEEEPQQTRDPLHGRVRRAFGKVLKAARTARGMSQQQLANSAGADRSYLSMLERGLQQPTLAMLLRISKALDTEPEKLVTATLELLEAEDASASSAQADRQAA
jgi:transcriptional regulator with XRE-family HTH domain